MGPILGDVRYACRGLRSSPPFSFLALSALALGIGANAAIFSVVDRVLLRPLPYSEPEELVAVGGTLVGLDGRTFTASSEEFRDLRERSRTLGDLAASWTMEANLSGGVEAERVRAQLVTPGFFSLLGVHPFLGRGFVAEDTQGDVGSVALLSYASWERHFRSDPDILGKTIRLDGDPLTVVGVMPAGLEHPGDSPASSTALWIPLYLGPGDRVHVRILRPLELVGRLAPGASLEAAKEELARVAREFAEEFPEAYPQDAGWNLEVMALRDRFVGGIRPSMLILVGAVAFVLLTACINVAGLLLVRGQTRVQEIAVRSALGGGRGRIARQLFTESLVLALGGGLAALLVAFLTLEGLGNLAASVVPEAAAMALNGRVLGITAGVSLFACLAFGLFPALHSSRANLQELLRHRVGEGRGVGTLRNIFTTAQVGISVVLLVGAGLLFRSTARIRSADPGFEAENVLVLQTSLSVPEDPAEGSYRESGNRRAFAAAALSALAEIPSVQEVAVTSLVPFRGLLGWPFFLNTVEAPQGGSFPQTEQRSVSEGYFSAMGIPILQGRGLTAEDDESHAQVVVVDRRFVEEHLEGEPLGQRIMFLGNEWREIVGVVGNVKESPFETTPLSHAYTPYRQYLGRNLSFVVKTRGRPGAVTEAASGAVQRADPNQPVFAVSSLETILADAVGKERLLTTLISVFAGLAGVLAAIGIFGVVNYTVQRRRREIGVRVALGADGVRVLSLALRDVALIGGAGIALGLMVAVPATRLLAGVLHQVSRYDLTTYAAVVALSSTVVLAAAFFPAHGATRLDPLESIRSD